MIPMVLSITVYLFLLVINKNNLVHSTTFQHFLFSFGKVGLIGLFSLFHIICHTISSSFLCMVHCRFYPDGQLFGIFELHQECQRQPHHVPVNVSRRFSRCCMVVALQPLCMFVSEQPKQNEIMSHQIVYLEAAHI